MLRTLVVEHHLELEQRLGFRVVLDAAVSRRAAAVVDASLVARASGELSSCRPS
jgi:hypothetical protein